MTVLADVWGRIRKPVMLARIANGSVTLRTATTETITPDGNLWEAGFSCDPIRDEVGFMEPGPSPVVLTFRILNRTFAALAPSALTQTFASVPWKGSVVTLYLFNADRPDVAPAQIFEGRLDDFRYDHESAEFSAIDDRSWNRIVPETRVDMSTHPNAADTGSGQAEPIIYGAHTQPPLRGALAGLGREADFVNVGGARGVIPLIVTDIGTGADKLQLLAGRNAMADIFGSSGETGIYVAGAEGQLCPIDTTPGAPSITETLTGPSYVEIEDGFWFVWYPISPVDVRTGGGNNSALNPRRAFDRTDETQFATLDQGLGATKLDVLLPSPARFGKIHYVQVAALVSGDPGNAAGSLFRLYARDDATAWAAPSILTGSAMSSSISLVTGTYLSTWYNQNWAFGVHDGNLGYGGTEGNLIGLCVDFDRGAANKGRVHWIGLFAQITPARNIVSPGATELTIGQELRRQGHLGWVKMLAGNEFLNTVIRKGTDPTYNVQGSFFAHVKGYVDDGSGTFTGSAGALIERAPDVLAHFLVTHGQESGASIERGAGVHGSFADARGLLRNGEPDDFKLACNINQRSRAQDAAKRMAEQSLSTFWRSRFDSKWKFAPWVDGGRPTYRRSFSWDDILAISVGESSIVDVRHEVRVGFLPDAARGRMLAEAFVSAAGSSQGWSFPLVRDQLVKIEAGVNDALDWSTGAWGGGPFTFADHLAAGTYEPIEAAALLQAALRSHIGAYYCFAGHGFTIAAGFNDALEFGWNGTNWATTIPPGRYSADALAYAATAAMAQAIGMSGVLAITYAHATNKFVLTSTNGNVNTIGPATAVSPGTMAWPVMGWVAGTIGATTLTAPAATYAERYFTRNESTATVKFLHGTGASAATSCATVFGFPNVDTGTAASHAGTYSRGDRETQSSILEVNYGATDSDPITADWIRSEIAAVALRNRRWDLASRARYPVTIAVHDAFDLQRMECFTLEPDVDAHVPCPWGDGSWAGKVLRCLGNSQHAGPTFHNEIVAFRA